MSGPWSRSIFHVRPELVEELTCLLQKKDGASTGLSPNGWFLGEPVLPFFFFFFFEVPSASDHPFTIALVIRIGGVEARAFLRGS